MSIRLELVRRYSIGVIAPGVALLCALVISPPGASNPLVIPMFLIGVVASSWLGGRGPGLTASALGFLAIDYFFEEPLYSIAISSFSTAVELAAFSVCALMIGTLSPRSRRKPTALPAMREPSMPQGWPMLAQRDPAIERTLVIVKPDGVERALVGEVIARFERHSLRLHALKMMEADRRLIDQHYAHHRGKPFLDDVVAYMMSGPVVAMIFEGVDAVRLVRSLIGSPHPDHARAGTIRGDFAATRLRTLVHSADSRHAADRELALWFSPEELAAPPPLVNVRMWHSAAPNGRRHAGPAYAFAASG